MSDVGAVIHLFEMSKEAKLMLPKEVSLHAHTTWKSVQISFGNLQNTHWILGSLFLSLVCSICN